MKYKNETQIITTQTRSHYFISF